MPSMKDIEDYARAAGIPVEEAAQKFGMAAERAISPAANALQQMASQAWDGPQKPQTIPEPPSINRNDATLGDQGDYQKELSDKLHNIGSAEQAHQQWLNDNADDSGYTKYANGGQVANKFSHLSDMMKKHKKAGSELAASRDPMKFIKDNKNMSIKNKKGIAF